MTLCKEKTSRLAGLSLMEAMVVIGIMTILLFMVTDIFNLSYAIYQKQSQRTENESGAVLAANSVSRMTRGAVEVVDTYNFGGTNRSSSSTTLVLKIPSIDGSGNLIDGNYDYIAFYRNAIDSSKIMAIIDADPLSSRLDSTRLITGHNVRMDFRYNSPDPINASRISIYIQNEQTYRQLRLVTRGWTSIFMRNS